jgi:alpha-tubulin suppressor-like RCC1 family protein
MKVEGGLKFLAIAVGTATPVTTEVQQLSHTCGVTTELAIVCWGDNSNGQLGNGSTQKSDVPVKVSGTLKFRSVASGFSHTCGVTIDGDGYCWGYNAFGELGNGTTTSVNVPAKISGELKIK